MPFFTRVPKHGAVILASNHLSLTDSVFLPLMVSRRVTFLAKDDHVTGRGIGDWLTRLGASGTRTSTRARSRRRYRA